MKSEKSESEANGRYNHLEGQISGIAASLDGFIKESAEYRARTEREQGQIWAAIREQGDNLRNAVEKLSMKGNISWPMIVSTLGIILSVAVAAAGVGHALMESRIKQVEIRVDYNERDLDRQRELIRP